MTKPNFKKSVMTSFYGRHHNYITKLRHKNFPYIPLSPQSKLNQKFFYASERINIRPTQYCRQFLTMLLYRKKLFREVYEKRP